MTTSVSQQQQTISDIYAAFGRGDVPAILDRLSADVDWEYGGSTPGVPWLQQRKGRTGAAEFFASLAAMEIHHFAVKAVLGGDDLVVALVDIEFTVRATGKRVVEPDETHLWRFDDQGLVSGFRHRIDTYTQAEACRG